MRMRNDTRLKQLLNKYNVTQQSFADMLCVTKYTAWKIINNKRPLRSDEIVKICEKFNVSANWLLGLNELSNPYDIEVLDKIIVKIKAMFPLSGKWMYDEGYEKEHIVCEVLSDVLTTIDRVRMKGGDKK